jgi:hypothetical protein
MSEKRLGEQTWIVLECVHYNMTNCILFSPILCLTLPSNLTVHSPINQHKIMSEVLVFLESLIMNSTQSPKPAPL